MRPINLPALYPIDRSIGSAYALPVLVELNWYGCTMTSDNVGIIPSRSAHSIIHESDDSIIL